jgi:cellulose synthase/poly-beta-1,6-N-acetylglucosamine synthase-like glycosyltransferase
MTTVNPSICVLIPAYNEETVLDGTIDALLAAGCNLRDIYVVDDKSTDNTAEIARQRHVNVYTVPENGGKARAQRQALNHFGLTDKYDWVVFLDGDSKVDIGFLEALSEVASHDPSVGLYVGQVKSVNNNHVYSAARAHEYTYGHDVTKHGQSNFNVVVVSPGCASMYRSDVLEQLHIDPTTLAEDMDLTMQVHRRGHSVKYVPSAGVYTQDPNNFGDYYKQILRWYRGFWQVLLKHHVLSFTRKQRVDWYILFMLFDSVVFNRIVWLMGAFALFPTNLLLIIGADIGFMSAIAVYVAYRTRRWDVIYRLPQYYWFSHLSFFVYVRTFIEIVILRKTMLSWNKVKRYSFDSHVG